MSDKPDWADEVVDEILKDLRIKILKIDKKRLSRVVREAAHPQFPSISYLLNTMSRVVKDLDNITKHNKKFSYSASKKLDQALTRIKKNEYTNDLAQFCLLNVIEEWATKVLAAQHIPAQEPEKLQ